MAIETTGLTKRYAEVTAVDNLELQVRPGEVYGFLGRNGAGKTTTIRMLLGLVRPSAGRIRIFDRDLATCRPEAVALVGSLVETATAYPTLTVRENLEIQRRLTLSDLRSMEEVVQLLGLQELENRRAGRLSLGNKQRLALARALLSGPRLVILDEPANALDPAGIVEIRRLLRRLADERGVTVFVSSHILGEVSQLADRIGIIHRGRLVEEIDSKALDQPNHRRLVIQVSSPEKALPLLRDLPGVDAVLALPEGALEVSGPAPEPAVAARAMVEAGIDIHALVPSADDLESRFLRLTGDE